MPDRVDVSRLCSRWSFLLKSCILERFLQEIHGGFFSTLQQEVTQETEGALLDAAGLSGGEGSGWVNHHIGYDPGTNTMRGQLVDPAYHSDPHIGGVNEYEKFTGCEYIP